MTRAPVTPHADAIRDAAEFLRKRGIDGPFAFAVVLGTGLGALVEDLGEVRSLPYAGIPHFPGSGVSGHAGRLTVGRLGKKRVLVLQGRAHYYEAGDPAAMRVPLGVAAALGASALLLTNAAGSTDSAIAPGSLVAISDHINYSGLNPLIGDDGDGRFVSMTDAYDAALRGALARAAGIAGMNLREGVYMWFSGPSFETPAEIRMARILGADLVGMSTVPETILARCFGMRVAALSVVTNLAAGIEGASPSHDETKAVGARASGALRRLIRAFADELAD